jgi:hypothetical protein
MIAAKSVAFALELPAQFYVIVNFAVKDDADIAFLIPHRLGTACNVENREAPMTEENPLLVINEYSLAIWPAMYQGLRHRGEIGATTPPDEPCDSAHELPIKIDERSHGISRALLRFEISPNQHLRQEAHEDAHAADEERHRRNQGQRREDH